MERIALSATPFNWCTCGGQMEVCTPSNARSSVNSRDRNLPALSLWSVPTMRVHRLVTGVVIHDHESIFAGAVDGLDEGPGDVHMYETPGICRSVAIAGVWLTGKLASRQAEHDGGRDCDRLAG
eukprot:274348-Pleurochrysis_carterae.AAC.1